MLGIVAGAAICAACHGPPIMSRITPRYVQPRTPTVTAPRMDRTPRADPLRAPFLEKEGRPQSMVTDAMIDQIERAVRLRQEAKRRRARTPCTPMEQARRMGDAPAVGQEERGSIGIDLCRLYRFFRRSKPLAP